jgi:hypothetical protein
MYKKLPADFRDRPHRWYWNILVFLGLKEVKAVCCESFRKPEKMRACKGCATRYDKESASPFYRFIAKHAKIRAEVTK